MVDLAEKAFEANNPELASEIYERVIREKGPAAHLFISLGNCLAESGRISEAFIAFLKAYRLATVSPSKLKYLVKALVKLARETMEAINGRCHNSLMLDTKTVVESEPFFCGVCLGTVQGPTTIYCGHTFCKGCVAKIGKNSCIICGQNPSVSDDFRVNVLMDEVMRLLFPRLSEIGSLKADANNRCTEGNFEKAVELYSVLLELCETEHTVWSNRSHAFYMLGDYERALSDANQAIKTRPQWAKGYYRRGVAEEALERPQEAAISYMKCLALDGNADTANRNLRQIIHKLLLPSISSEDLKNIPSSTSAQPMTELMAASSSSDDEMIEGIQRIRSLLDEQFKEFDTSLHFDARIDKIDSSSLSSENFQCSLCYRLLHEPTTTPCGHVFCRLCLSRCLDHSIDCPQCRGSLAEFLAMRRSATTMSLQQLILKWFPKEAQIREEQHKEDIASFSLTEATAIVPIFVCTIAFPTLSCPLHIFEPRYRHMMRQVMESGVRQFGMCIGSSDGEGFADYGTMLEIVDIQFFPDGRSVVDTVGGRRFRVLERGEREGYHIAKVEFLEEARVDGNALQELKTLHDDVYHRVSVWISQLPSTILQRITTQCGQFPPQESEMQCRLGPQWVWWIAAILPINNVERAQLVLLSMNSLKDRLVLIDKALQYYRRD